MINIDYNHQTSFPTVIENPPLYSVTVGVGSYITESLKEVYKSEIPISGKEIIAIEYEESINLSAIVTDAELINADFYTAYAELTILGNGIAKIIVTGNPITRIERIYEKQYGITGEILPFENTLCTNVLTAGIIASMVGDFYVTRSVYNANYNGNILIEPMDIIFTENDFEKEMKTRVISNTIEHNGAWKGGLKWSRLS